MRWCPSMSQRASGTGYSQPSAPGRWAKALAVWTIEGTHGTICGVVERASGEDADECRREYGE